MDLAYLRAHPEHIPAFLTHQRIRETPVSGGSICVAQRLTLDGGDSVFTKALPSAPAGFFTAESNGLRWLRESQTVAVPEVIASLPGMLVLEWIDSGEPDAAGAEQFGRDLAALHRSGTPTFGAHWAGYIGSMPLDNTPSSGRWSTWFTEYRLLPYLRSSVDAGTLDTATLTDVERVIDRIDELAGAAGSEAPARIHGDLWPGNLVWGTGGRCWVVDPAAHGGHRETDLATLALFGGVPFGERIIGAYHEAWPLADGWRERIPLHQLHLLLVHTAAFGAGYAPAVHAAARALI